MLKTFVDGLLVCVGRIVVLHILDFYYTSHQRLVHNFSTDFSTSVHKYSSFGDIYREMALRVVRRAEMSC